MVFPALKWLVLVQQLQPFLDKCDLATVRGALIVLRLDYGSTLLKGMPLKTFRRVENTAVGLLTGIRRGAVPKSPPQTS